MKQAILQNKKLKDLHSNDLDVKTLMSDDMLVNRFTEHLCNIMFNFSDPWLKNKYKQFKGGNEESFFDRM
jgi:tRNA G46 methylase TrmB